MGYEYIPAVLVTAIAAALDDAYCIERGVATLAASDTKVTIEPRPRLRLPCRPVAKLSSCCFILSAAYLIQIVVPRELT